MNVSQKNMIQEKQYQYYLYIILSIYFRSNI